MQGGALRRHDSARTNHLSPAKNRRLLSTPQLMPLTSTFGNVMAGSFSSFARAGTMGEDVDNSELKHGCATIVHEPLTQLLLSLRDEVLRKLEKFTPQNVSNTLWALAALSFDPGPVFLFNVTKRLRASLAQYKARDLTKLLWAFAVLHHSPGHKMLRAFCETIRHRMSTLTHEEVSSAGWALAQLHHHPGEDLLQEMADHIAAQAGCALFTPQTLSDAMSFYGLFEFRPEDSFLPAVVEQLEQHLAPADPRQQPRTPAPASPLSPTKQRSAQVRLEIMEAELSASLDSYAPSDLADTICAYAKWHHRPGDALLEALTYNVQRCLAQFSAQEVARVAVAVSKLQQAPDPALLLRLDHEARRRRFRPDDAATLLCAYARLPPRPAAPLAPLLEGVLGSLPQLRPAALCRVLWALARLQAVPGSGGCPATPTPVAAAQGGWAADRAAVALLAGDVEVKAHKLKPREMVTALRSLQALGQALSKKQCQAVARALVVNRTAFRAHEVMEALRTLMQMGLQPTQELIDAIGVEIWKKMRFCNSAQLTETLVGFSAMNSEMSDLREFASMSPEAVRATVSALAPLDIANMLCAQAIFQVTSGPAAAAGGRQPPGPPAPSATARTPFTFDAFAAPSPVPFRSARKPSPQRRDPVHPPHPIPIDLFPTPEKLQSRAGMIGDVIQIEQVQHLGRDSNNDVHAAMAERYGQPDRGAADEEQPTPSSGGAGADAAGQHRPGSPGGEAARPRGSFPTRPLSNIMWGFAKLRHHPGAQAMEGVQRAVGAEAAGGRLPAEEASSFLWAFAKLGDLPNKTEPSVIELLHKIAVAQASKYTGPQLSSTLWAMGALKTNYPREYAAPQAVLTAVTNRLPYVQAQVPDEELQTMWSAFEVLQHSKGMDQVEALQRGRLNSPNSNQISARFAEPKLKRVSHQARIKTAMPGPSRLAGASTLPPIEPHSPYNGPLTASASMPNL